MLRTALMIALAASGTVAMDASAAEVRLAYKAVVTQANGPHASAFAPGQEIHIRYAVETTTPDSNPNASAGVYNNGLRELRIEIPAAGVNVSTGPGYVQTFNDVGSDQAFFYSYNASGQLGGLAVTHAEVDFVDSASAMLASDAIPTVHLLPDDNSIFFGTSAGYTSVRFLAQPEPVATCASEGYTGTQLQWCQNICEKGYTGATLDAWIHRWQSKFRELPYCAAK